MLDLSVIIVSYNTKDLLEQCLDSIQENVSKKLTYEVIVVDNASTDGSVEKVKSEKLKVKNNNKNLMIIENKSNVGFSRANNIGVKQAKGKYILFLNSDTKVYQHTIEEMVGFMDFHAEAGAATCYVELSNGELDDAAHRGFPTPWNAICHFSGLGKMFPHSSFFNGYHLAWRGIDTIHEIDALAGAFMIVRRIAGEQVGWWDEDYFFYGEDLDFCYKLKQKGWKIYFVPHVKILHYKGVSSGIKKVSQNITTANKASKIKIQKARFEAMRIFYRKHYNKKYPYILTKLVLLGVAAKERIILQKI